MLNTRLSWTLKVPHFISSVNSAWLPGKNLREVSYAGRMETNRQTQKALTEGSAGRLCFQELMRGKNMTIFSRAAAVVIFKYIETLSYEALHGLTLNVAL